MCIFLAGAFSDLEMHVRIFFRRVFLNQCQSKVEKAFWLNLITKPFPMVHQARILFLLYGPICDSEQTAFKLFKGKIVMLRQIGLNKSYQKRLL